MYVDKPKTSRSYGAWKRMRDGLSPASLSERGHSRAVSYGDGHSVNEKEGFGFGRNGKPNSSSISSTQINILTLGSDQSHTAFVTRPMNARLSRAVTVSTTSSHGRSPPNYTPSPRSQYSAFPIGKAGH